jgi:multiple sugar transport system substrate-binding protein
MAEVAATGDVIALNSYMAKDGRPGSYFYPAMMKASTFSGKVYSFPTDGGDYAILYNKKIFKEAGITATPTTWAQVAADSAKITSKLKGIYGFYVPFGVNEWTVWTFESMLWSEGGHFLNNNGTKALFGSPAGVAGLNVWVNLLKKHLAYPSSLANSSQNSGYPGFQDGKVAMYIDGSYRMGIDDTALGKANVGVFQFPKTKEYAMNTGTNQSFMLKGTPAQEACEWDYLKYMTEPSVQAKWDVATGFIPTVRAVAQTPTYKAFVAKDPRLNVFVHELQYAHTRPSIQNYAQISAELGKQIEAALMQQETAKAALSAAQSQANQILASSAG